MPCNPVVYNGVHYRSLASLVKAIKPTISLNTIKLRMSRKGWSLKRAIITPEMKSQRAKNTSIKVAGKNFRSIKLAVEHYNQLGYNFSYNKIAARLRNGWPPNQAFEIIDRHKAKRSGYIYLITNKITNEVYVGATVRSLKTRFSDHKAASNYKSTKLYYAMQCYGTENFTIRKLKTVKSYRDLQYYEQKFIDKYDSINFGYNMVKSTGGFGKRTGTKIKIKGTTYYSIQSAADAIGISYSGLHKRIATGRQLDMPIGRYEA